MSARILKGAPVAEAICQRLAPQIEALRAAGVTPCLAVVRAGENPGDMAYHRGIVKKCETLSIDVKSVIFPQGVTQEEFTAGIEGLNADCGVHGILVLKPLPPQLDAGSAPAWEKDVDGAGDVSLAGVFAGTGRGFPPCTARACVEILDHYRIPIEGKRAVIIGRSLTVGKPLGMLLLARNATVTICHSRSADIKEIAREADILIVALGRAGFVDRSFLSPGQCIIDVGINVDAAGAVTGDVNFAEAAAVAGSVTPVPGGVGAVTTPVLAAHVVETALRQQ